MNQKVRGLSFFSSWSSQRSRVSGFCVVIFVTLINEEGRQNNWSRSINCFELKRRLREGITIYLCNFVTGHRNFLSLEPGLSSPGPRALITPGGDIGGGSLVIAITSCENNERIEKIVFYAHTELVNKRFPVWLSLWSRSLHAMRNHNIIFCFWQPEICLLPA